MNKITGLQFLEKFQFNVMPFWHIRSIQDIPSLQDKSLVNIRSLGIWDMSVSYVNLRFNFSLIKDIFLMHGSFILQASFPRKYNLTTNTLRIDEGEISHLEIVKKTITNPVVETRDIAGGRVKEVITLPRWRALRCNHLMSFRSELRDLEILLKNGTHIVEFNTTKYAVGIKNQRIIFWEIINEKAASGLQ